MSGPCPPADVPSVLVAEDEAPQRAALLAMLGEAWPQLERILDCADGVEALQAVAAQRPRVAFLDIRMPGVSGLDVARAVVAYGGEVVFTTAYDEYAIGAFEAGALDYLLKPVQPARLARTVARLRERLAQPDDPALQERIDALEARLRPRDGRLVRWISASVGDSVRMVGVDDVLFFQARDKYVRVVSGDGEAMIRTPLKELLAGLDPEMFWQVHRGVVVRVAAIDRVHRDELGKWRLQLRGHAQTLPVSAAFVHRFRGM